MFFTKVVILKLNNMKFTIFTPTYNRAHTLTRLYESLLNQKFINFEWLIVDDGSTDGTQSLVESFTAENKINIRYVFQENGGKHIAINTALENTSADWFVIIDSDDYLRKCAMFKIKELADHLDEKFAGFTGIRFSEKINFNPSQFGNKAWTEDHSYQWAHHGEMGFIWRAAIVKQFPFPVFEGEKFCQESLVLRRIMQKHPVLFTDHVLFGGDYLEDGLTANVWNNMLKSPRYSMLNYSERIDQNIAKTKEQEMDFAKKYWDIALSAQHIPWTEKLLGISFILTAKVFTQKIRDRFSAR